MSGQTGVFAVSVGKDAEGRGFMSVAVGDGVVVEDDFAVVFKEPWSLRLTPEEIGPSLEKLGFIRDLQKLLGREEAVKAIEHVMKEILGCLKKNLDEAKNKASQITQGEIDLKEKEKVADSKMEEID